MPTTFTSLRVGYGAIALGLLALSVSGLALFRNAVYFQAPITGTGSTIQIAVSPTKSGTGQVVDGWLVLTTQVSNGGCASTGGVAAYNTCYVAATGSNLLWGKNRDSTMSGRLIKSIAVFGDATPVGTISIDMGFKRDASGGSGSGGTNLLNNVVISTGSTLLRIFSGSNVPLVDRNEMIKVSSLSSNTARSTFRVLINYMDQFDQ